MKHFRINGKKAVSPLIATVLLIAFAVALGAVVMNWGQSFTKQTMEGTETTQKTTMGCSFDVVISEVEIGGVPRICYDDSAHTVDFSVRNTGNKDITGLQIQIIGSTDEIVSEEINETLPVGMMKKHTTDSYSAAGDFSQIVITPEISVSGSTVLCSGQAIIKDSTELNVC